jgi:hypothetical protein
MNGWFARSLGSSDAAAWLFLAVGIAADCTALALPNANAAAWKARQRVTAAVGWAVCIMTFVFAVTAGIGFASVNIADVTQARASPVTPARYGGPSDARRHRAPYRRISCLLLQR